MGFQELFNSHDQKKRKSHFKNLLAVAMADGKLENVEYDYIIQLAEKCYMTPTEVQRVINNPTTITFHPPRSVRERFDQIYDLVSVMLVDGHVDKKEITLCRTFAMRLGFRTAIVDKLVDDMVDYAMKGIAVELAIQELLTETEWEMVAKVGRTIIFSS